MAEACSLACSLSKMHESKLENFKTKIRFYKKVRKLNRCWIWKGGKNKTGYGRFFFKNRLWSSHRCMWEMTNGDIPKGMNVLHRCDNPSCVNPEHLFLGTQKDNMSDCIKKGRKPNKGPFGERNAMAVIKTNQVR